MDRADGLTAQVPESESRYGRVRVLHKIVATEVSDADGDGIWVASNEALSSVYGAGDGPRAAALDYFKNLVEHYEWLYENHDSLGRAMLREYEALSNYLSIR